MFRRILIATAVTLGSLGGLVGVAAAATMNFEAVLSGKSEVPPNAATGTGEVLATLDTVAKTLTYTMTFQGLTGPAMAAHFHGPAAAGANAGVVAEIGKNLSGPVSAKITLTDAQIKDLTAGMWYVNVHTDANKGGELRGQMVHKVEGRTTAAPKAPPAMKH
jgi:hypothetical protein